MDRDPLFRLLERVVEAFPDSAEDAGRVRALAESRRDCFERTCLPGHLTGSAWITSPDRSVCLLTHHRKLGKWLQLGGHADGEHRVEEVALAEAREESGLAEFVLPRWRGGGLDGQLVPLDVDVHVIPERRRSDGRVEVAHEHHDLRFLLLTDPTEPLVISEESHDLAWVPVEDLERYTDEESVLRLRERARAWPL